MVNVENNTSFQLENVLKVLYLHTYSTVTLPDYPKTLSIASKRLIHCRNIFLEPSDRCRIIASAGPSDAGLADFYCLTDVTLR